MEEEKLPVASKKEVNENFALSLSAILLITAVMFGIHRNITTLQERVDKLEHQVFDLELKCGRAP